MNNILSGLIWAVWRRLYGKGNSGISRGILAAFAIGSLTMVFYKLANWDIYGTLRLIAAAGTAVFAYAYYWSKGHGMIMDKGTGGKPTPELLARYEKTLGYQIACRVLPESEWYGYKFDSLMMIVRYGLPALGIAILTLSPVLIWAGLLPSPIYTACLYLEKKRPAWFKRWSWLASYKDLAEILVGFQFGFVCMAM